MPLSLPSLLLLFLSVGRPELTLFPTVPRGGEKSDDRHPTPIFHTEMSHLSADQKHTILLEYSPHDSRRSFHALARRFAVKGGGRTIQRWHAEWDRTPQSLERREGSGRAPILTPAEVGRYIRAPILAANHAYHAIHYTEVHDQIEEKTGKSISLPTVQRFGKEQLGGHNRHTHKRTEQERE